MMSLRALKNRNGMTLAEVLVALALSVTIGSVFISGFLGMKRISQSTLTLSATDREINEVIENLRIGIENYQFLGESSLDSMDEVLEPTQLPIAWDIGIQADPKDCHWCAGRLGYLIQPYPGTAMKGLYLVTLRMSHRDWVESTRDFQFVVTVK